jgi:hypothetical protein
VPFDVHSEVISLLSVLKYFKFQPLQKINLDSCRFWSQITDWLSQLNCYDLLIPSRHIPGYCFKLGHSYFLSHFHFIINYLAIWCYIVWAAGSNIKWTTHKSDLRTRLWWWMLAWFLSLWDVSRFDNTVEPNVSTICIFYSDVTGHLILIKLDYISAVCHMQHWTWQYVYVLYGIYISLLNV